MATLSRAIPCLLILRCTLLPSSMALRHTLPSRLPWATEAFPSRVSELLLTNSPPMPGFFIKGHWQEVAWTILTRRSQCSLDSAGWIFLRRRPAAAPAPGTAPAIRAAPTASRWPTRLLGLSATLFRFSAGHNIGLTGVKALTRPLISSQHEQYRAGHSSIPPPSECTASTPAMEARYSRNLQAAVPTVRTIRIFFLQVEFGFFEIPLHWVLFPFNTCLRGGGVVFRDLNYILCTN